MLVRRAASGKSWKSTPSVSHLETAGLCALQDDTDTNIDGDSASSARSQ